MFTPLVAELDSSLTPQIALRLLGHLPHVCLLHSGGPVSSLARYSFLAADPFDCIRLADVCPDPLAGLAQRISALPRQEPIAGLPPMQGGAMGLLSYDLGRCFEKIPAPVHNEFEYPLLDIGFYDVVVSWDHQQNRVWLISQGLPEQESRLRAIRASKRLEFFRDLLQQSASLQAPPGVASLQAPPGMRYCASLQAPPGVNSLQAPPGMRSSQALPGVRSPASSNAESKIREAGASEKGIPGGACNQEIPGGACNQENESASLQAPPGMRSSQALPGVRSPASSNAESKIREAGASEKGIPGRACNQRIPGGACNQEIPGRACNQGTCSQEIPGRACNQGLPGVHGTAHGLTAEQFDTRLPQQWIGSFGSAEFRAAVSKIRDYIAAGDVFQVNLAQRLIRPTICDSIELYNALSLASPAPFAGYFNAGDYKIVSSSPERFLKLDADRRVETRPIKGTRPRGKTPAEDQRLHDELAASEKDRAENTMIVDLLRNDLSRVCDIDSVEVPQLCQIETYAQVQHMVSEVCGRLRDGLEITDLIAATFPGGSITGAPKIRAMEIIAELEPTTRGPYCGSMGYVALDGSSDWNILIRTILVKSGWWQLNVGGGIVYDSDPIAEEEETWTKAAGMVAAIEMLLSQKN